MLSSNSYEFKNTPIDELILEAFERVGIAGNEITGEQIKSAIRSSNLELIEWQGRTPLQFLKKMFLVEVKPNESTVAVDPNTTKIVDVIFTQPMRLNSGGEAASSSVPTSGSAQNCFSNQLLQGCVLTGANSWISYSYPITMQSYPCISYVGIDILPTNAQYQIVVEYSYDNETWVNGYTDSLRTYLKNRTTWLVVEKTSNARFWRIREVSNSPTFEISQIYFCTTNSQGFGDRAMDILSQSDYMALSFKNGPASGYPTSCFYNPQISPYMKLYPVLSPSMISNSRIRFNCILYSAYQFVQTVDEMFLNFNIPPAFYEALVAGVAKRLAEKFKPEKYEMLSRIAAERFGVAGMVDSNPFSLHFSIDYR